MKSEEALEFWRNDAFSGALLRAIYEVLGERLPDAEPGGDDRQRFGPVANRAYRWGDSDAVGVDVAWCDEEGVAEDVNVPFRASVDDDDDVEVFTWLRRFSLSQPGATEEDFLRAVALAEEAWDEVFELMASAARLEESINSIVMDLRDEFGVREEEDEEGEEEEEEGGPSKQWVSQQINKAISALEKIPWAVWWTFNHTAGRENEWKYSPGNVDYAVQRAQEGRDIIRALRNALDMHRRGDWIPEEIAVAAVEVWAATVREEVEAD